MKVTELRACLQDAIDHPERGGGIQLVNSTQRAPFPKKGWPRGELLCTSRVSTGLQSVWLYDAKKLLDALNKHLDALKACRACGSQERKEAGDCPAGHWWWVCAGCGAKV